MKAPMFVGALCGLCVWFVQVHEHRMVEHLQWAHTSEQVAREGKTDKEWYEKHPQAGGSSAHVKTQEAD